MGALEPCGTLGAWWRHYRNDEAADDACQNAKRADDRTRRQARDAKFRALVKDHRDEFRALILEELRREPADCGKAAYDRARQRARTRFLLVHADEDAR